MSKQITLVKIHEPHGNIRFNVNVGTTEKPDYYPIQVMMDFTPQTADGVSGKPVRITKNMGTNQATPFDFSTVEGIKALSSALPAFAQEAFKEGVLEVINEDTSIQA